MQSTAPAFFKPTTTLLIDDDERYIKNVASLLPDHSKAKVLTSDKLEAYLDSELFTTIENFSTEKTSISVDSLMHFFAENINSPPVSTIVMDYDMGPKDGLSIFKRFKSSFVQKILISNFLEDDISRDALNQGIIDFYLPKMDPHFIDKLTTTIDTAQSRFFGKLSSLVPAFFSETNPLNEPALHKLFKSVQTEYDSSYYESYNHLRKFTFFDKNMRATATIHIYPEEHMAELVNSLPAESASPEILELISSGKAIPVFSDGVMPNGNEWHRHLEPAKFLNNTRKYVYTICGAQ